MIFFKHCLLPFHTSFKLSPQGLGVCPVWPRPPLHPPNTHPPVTGKGPSAIRSWCEATLYLSHFTTSLFITDRHKWTSPRGWCQCYPSVYPPHTHTDTPLSLPSLSFLSPAGPTVSLPACFFPLKLLQLEPTNYQHVQSADRSTEGENTNHKVQVQHSSPVLYCIVAACSGFSAALTPDGLNKTDPGCRRVFLWQKKRGEWNTGRRGEEWNCFTGLRINASSQFQGHSHQAAPLSGKHKQAWCVDYKCNPLIITERMEEFWCERGKEARHWIPIIRCMLAAGWLWAPAVHTNLPSAFTASTLLPADKKTSLKTSNHILHTNYSITWRGAEDMGEMEVVVVVMGAAWPELCLILLPPRPFRTWLFLNFIFEFEQVWKSERANKILNHSAGLCN